MTDAPTVKPSDIDDDLTRVLALAKRAINARFDEAAGSWSAEKQIGHHSACCDAVWDELERLVRIKDGITPALESPAERERRIANEIRVRIIGEILDIATERLETTVDGAFSWEEPGAMTRFETEDLL